jgi:hypothetical protein
MDEWRAPLHRARRMLSVQLLIDRGLDVRVVFVARFKEKKHATVTRGYSSWP